MVDFSVLWDCGGVNILGSGSRVVQEGNMGVERLNRVYWRVGLKYTRNFLSSIILVGFET